MNTGAFTPGYIVEVSSWTKPDIAPTKSFIDADLLTARQAAFKHAQGLVAQKESTDVLDVTIYLAEFEGGKAITPYITQVFAQRFHRVQSTRRARKRGGINLTIDPTLVDEAFESPEAVLRNVSELTCEYEYYLSYGHAPGFGYVELVIAGPHDRAIVDRFIEISNDEELTDIRREINKPLRCRMCWLLYDALSYAANLIGNYNKSYAFEGEHLAFYSEFLPISASV